MRPQKSAVAALPIALATEVLSVCFSGFICDGARKLTCVDRHLGLGGPCLLLMKNVKMILP